LRTIACAIRSAAAGRAFEKAIETLREQLTKAERRADEAEEAERHALELVKHVTAEANEQRKRADDPRDEAPGCARGSISSRRAGSGRGCGTSGEGAGLGARAAVAAARGLAAPQGAGCSCRAAWSLAWPSPPAAGRMTR